MNNIKMVFLYFLHKVLNHLSVRDSSFFFRRYSRNRMNIVYSADTCFGRHCKMTETSGVDNTSFRNHAYSNILKILPPNNENFRIKNSDIFHISAQNIDCGYSLEPPRQGRNKKTNVYPWKPVLLYKSGV